MQRVTSRHNPRLVEAVRLVHSARERRKAGRCVLEGAHAIGVFVGRIGVPETVIVVDDAMGQADIGALLDRIPPARTLTVSRTLFAELATVPADVAILAVVPTPRAQHGTLAEFCLLLENVQDPGNVGSILRSAAAAGVTQAWLSSGCSFAWSPKVLRSGQGAQFLLAIHEDDDLVAWARAFRGQRGSVIATVARDGIALPRAVLPRRLALAIGNEGSGLSAALLDQADLRVTIPMPGGMESLNVAAAAAVCLYECVRQGVGNAPATA